MTVDLPAGLARRAFSDHPVEYPVSGAKPIHRDSWFDIVHGAQRSFVANTLGDIAKVFPDFDLIGSLGCGSVVNLPIILEGELAETINILNAEHSYTDERVGELESKLTLLADNATLKRLGFRGNSSRNRREKPVRETISALHTATESAIGAAAKRAGGAPIACF